MFLQHVEKTIQEGTGFLVIINNRNIKMKGGNLNQTFLNVTSYLQILSCFTYGFYYRRTDKSVGIKSISFNLPTELNLWEILVSNV